MPPRPSPPLLVLALLAICALRTAGSTTIPRYFSGFWSEKSLGPVPSPDPSPEPKTDTISCSQGTFGCVMQRPPGALLMVSGTIATHAAHKHHRSRSPVVLPSSSPSVVQGCTEITCSAPLTSTPIGSPCGCVYPMQVQIYLAVAPYQLFPRVEELEIEIAAGTFLKQSQVRIMGAGSSLQDPEKTTVTIDLVPLGEKFDRTSALLTYDRFLRKKVPINTSIFGDYSVIYINYPGLPSAIRNSASLGPIRSHENPFGANVHARSTQKMNSKIIAIIALSAVVFVLLCFGICIVWKWKGLERPRGVGPISSSSIMKKTGTRSSFSSVASSPTVSFTSTIATCPPTVKTFSISELEKATDNFSFSKILGEGGYGRVYRGVIADGIEVAVKLLTRKHESRDREFIAEVEMLSRLHHRNLVKLIGVCIERSMRCLVFELVPNGSVESHLHGPDRMRGPLDLHTRMKIALGAARGLAYLHEDANPHVIHRDFKASNVLLENDFTPKVADFGLAKEASDGIDHISTQVMGTFGYVAPEYAMTGHLLVKSDVYSYGVVLLELLSGRKPVDMSRPQGSENLVTWARPLLTTKEGLQQLIDPSLHGPNSNFDKLGRAAAVASMCVHAEASHRPFMGEVVQALKLICNDTDETSSASVGCTEEFSSEAATPRLALGHRASCATVEYSSSGAAEEMQRPRSTSGVLERIESLAMYDWSGPLSSKKKGRSFYRLRGSMSEHGHPSRDCGVEGYWI